MGREQTRAEQEGSTEEGSLGDAGNAEVVENMVGEGSPSRWEKQVPLGSLEMGEVSLEAQARGQCS
jgi:hypothetical protein